MKNLLGLSYNIKQKLEDMIYSGNFDNGQLPSERELAEFFGVNRQTIRSAISSLCNEGLLQSIPGKGTFLAPEKYILDISFEQCLRDMLEKSQYSYFTNCIYERNTSPPDYVIAAFEMQETQQVETQLNVIYINREPVAYETIYTLDTRMKANKKERVKFSLSKSTEEESLFLGIAKRSDVIVERTFEYAGDKVIKIHSSIIVGSRFTFIY